VQVRSIISSFGTLKAFSLLRDGAGAPSGTALAEFTDPGVLTTAIAGESCNAGAAGASLALTCH
jgi:hypothetical protein